MFKTYLKRLREIREILTRPERKKITFIIIGYFILAFGETFSIAAIIPIMNLYISPEKLHSSKLIEWFYNFIHANSFNQFMTVLVLITIVLVIFKLIYAVYISYMKTKVLQFINVRLSNQLLQGYLYKNYEYHLNTNSSILIRNMTSEIGYFITFITSNVNILTETLIILFILILLGVAYFEVTIISIVFLTVLLAVNLKALKKKIRLYSEKRHLHGDQFYKYMNESLTGVKDIQFWEKQDFFIRRFSDEFRSYTKFFVKYSVFGLLPRYVLEGALFVSMLLVLLFTTIFKFSPSDVIPVISVFALASMKILPSLSSINNELYNVQYYANAVDRLKDILKEVETSKTKKEELLKSVDCSSFNDTPSIELRDVNFQYQNAKGPTLVNINLTFKAGTTYCLVGKSGSGKSTLVDILLGLLIPHKGEIMYNGVKINEGNVALYRANVGYVPQSIFLFDNTLKSNVAFGQQDEEIDIKHLKKVLEMAQVESFVEGLPDGYDTLIGEKGLRISGGQRQRLGIARALFGNPHILIFDEATSSLDAATESDINNTINNYRKDMLVILVAHRLNTIKNAEQIIVIKDGQVIDQGRLKELQKRCHVFNEIIESKEF